MSEPLFRVGEWLIDPNRRELRKEGGGVSVLPHKRLEGLLLLLENRHRVVPKREIESRLWPKAPPSGSSLARTMMLLRRDLAQLDPGLDPIRTVQGVGYRFVGDVIEERGTVAKPQRSADPNPAPAKTARRAARSLAILPCKVPEGDAACAWFAWGISSLVSRELAALTKLSVAPLEALIPLMQAPDAPTAGEAGAEEARRALGMDLVVTSRLTRQSTGFWLDYAVTGEGWVERGSLLDSDPVDLAARLAASLRTHCSGGGENDRGSSSLLGSDPFLAQAYARGVELMAQNKDHDACALMDAVCGAQPTNLEASLRLLHCLHNLDHRRAVAHGEALVKQARDAGDDGIEAQAHALVASAAMQLDRPEDQQRVADCRARAQALVVRASDVDPPPWTDRVRYELIRLTCLDGDWQAAISQALAAAQDLKQRGNEWLLRPTAMVAGEALLELHQPLAALPLLELGVGLAGKHRKPFFEAGVRCLMSLARCMLGNVDAGIEACRATCEGSDVLTLETGRAATLMLYAWVCAERLQGDVMSALIAAVVRSRSAESRRWPIVDNNLRISAAVPSMAQGRLVEAGALLLEGLDGCIEAGDWSGARIWSELMARVTAATQDGAALVDLRQRLMRCAALRANLQLMASLDRAGISIRLRQEPLQQTLQTLNTMILRLETSRELFLSRVDLAWLLLELGDTAQATPLVQNLGAYGTQHPAGLSVRARLAAARGDFHGAAELHAQALAVFGGALRPAWHEEAAACYANEKLPGRLDRLQSFSWLVDQAS